VRGADTGSSPGRGTATDAGAITGQAAELAQVQSKARGTAECYRNTSTQRRADAHELELLELLGEFGQLLLQELLRSWTERREVVEEVRDEGEVQARVGLHAASVSRQIA
jgi:hypothetical protein